MQAEQNVSLGTQHSGSTSHIRSPVPGTFAATHAYFPITISLQQSNFFTISFLYYSNTVFLPIELWNVLSYFAVVVIIIIIIIIIITIMMGEQ
jgi:hypothetical protein